MKAGKLRHHVNIFTRNVNSTDSHGHYVLGDPVQLYSDIPASIETLTGREAELARQIVASADTKITLRWLPNITPICWIEWNGITYNINAINNIENRDRELRLTCSGKFLSPTTRNQ